MRILFSSFEFELNFPATGFRVEWDTNKSSLFFVLTIHDAVSFSQMKIIFDLFLF